MHGCRLVRPAVKWQHPDQSDLDAARGGSVFGGLTLPDQRRAPSPMPLACCFLDLCACTRAQPWPLPGRRRRPAATGTGSSGPVIRHGLQTATGVADAHRAVPGTTPAFPPACLLPASQSWPPPAQHWSSPRIPLARSLLAPELAPRFPARESPAHGPGIASGHAKQPARAPSPR